MIKYDHKKAIMPRHIDDWTDYYLFRRVAGYLVRAVINTSVTPNQITFFSAVMGVCSGLFYYLEHPIIAAILLFSAVVFDCADGQLARAKGNGSPIGPLVDGLGDYSVAISLFVAGFYNLVSKYPDSMTAYIVILGAISSIAHCYLYDTTKHKYINNTQKNSKKDLLSYTGGKTLLKEAISKRDYVNIVPYLLLLVYFSGGELIEKISPKKNDGSLQNEFNEVHAKIYSESYQKVMYLWTFLGYSSHVLLFIIAFLCEIFFPKTVIYAFLFIIFPLNVYMIIVIIATYNATKRYQHRLNLLSKQS